MKRLVFLTVITLMALSLVWAAEHTRVRPDGVYTNAGGNYYVVVDSSDTLETDTLYSDTVEIDTGANWANIVLAVTGFSVCDSCNDSVLVIVKTRTSFEGITGRTIYTDTFATTLDSTEVIRHNSYRDTLIENLLWFETVIKDSVITTVADSLRVQLHYHVLTQ